MPRSCLCGGGSWALLGYTPAEATSIYKCSVAAFSSTSESFHFRASSTMSDGETYEWGVLPGRSSGAYKRIIVCCDGSVRLKFWLVCPSTG